MTRTSLSGDLDSIFCNQTHGVHELQADCGGDAPEVTCSCCTKCCTDGAWFCPVDKQQVCINYAVDWEVKKFQEAANCTCVTDNSSISCSLGDCVTCNEDSSVCGMTTAFDIMLDTNARFQTAKVSFQYSHGRPNSTVSWEYEKDQSCKVFVNGSECNLCNLLISCEDGFVGYNIDCGNFLNIDDGPTSYLSCFPEEGGVLDVFGWIDTASWTGCPLLPLREQ